MLKNSIYLLLGDDWVSKQRKISQIKKEAASTEIFYADEFSPDVLKGALYTLSGISQKRLVIIKEVDELSKKNKELIINFINNPNPCCILVLDTQVLSIEDNSFLQEISKSIITINLKKIIKRENVFDLCRALERRDCALGLNILSNLLVSGEKPLKILGGISWYWVNKKKFFGEDRFQRGIKHLLKVDTSIKTGKIIPNFALEFLVIRLAS